MTVTDGRGPLQGVRVLDFSTLLPGPFATLLLAEAGATVIKIERPGGDELRNSVSASHFPMLNRNKTSVVADLKDDRVGKRVLQLADGADVLVEQFRPGVMARHGLGYDVLAARNPGLVYCSITGFGQAGARAQVAGHDLNYVATTGLLSLVQDATGRPSLPPALIADIGGGTYPAVINILTALVARSVSGRGAHLDIAMTDNIWPLQYWSFARGLQGESPTPNGERLTGGSARYQIYPTADGRFIAAAPLEQRFWERFCAAIELPERYRDDATNPAATIAAVQKLIAARDVEHWRAVFAAADCCCSVVATIAEALADPGFAQRGVFDRTVYQQDGDQISRHPAMPVPLAAPLRTSGGVGRSPRLGELDLEQANWERAEEWLKTLPATPAARFPAEPRDGGSNGRSQ